MMTPCSAWCSPDEGIHVILSASQHHDTVEKVRAARVGRIQYSLPHEGTYCIPRGWVRITGIDHAEAPPFDGFGVTYLMTVQVVS